MYKHLPAVLIEHAAELSDDKRGGPLLQHLVAYYPEFSMPLARKLLEDPEFDMIRALHHPAATFQFMTLSAQDENFNGTPITQYINDTLFTVIDNKFSSKNQRGECIGAMLIDQSTQNTIRELFKDMPNLHRWSEGFRSIQILQLDEPFKSIAVLMLDYYVGKLNEIRKESLTKELEQAKKRMRLKRKNVKRMLKKQRHVIVWQF